MIFVLYCIAYDKHSCAMQYNILIRIDVQCIGIELLMFVQCIGNALLVISIVVIALGLHCL